ncbi:MAG TPA: phosphotransferase [Pseudonocardiaceae bacterium]|jgi:fructosamine-3-kinase|nr:phosphotransferase [Pseudonocardiaceae bacterium]
MVGPSEEETRWAESAVGQRVVDSGGLREGGSARRAVGTDCRPAALLREAKDAVARLPQPPCDPVFLHGDLWEGNTTWRDGELAAIIDWDCDQGRPDLDGPTLTARRDEFLRRH